MVYGERNPCGTRYLQINNFIWRDMKFIKTIIENHKPGDPEHPRYNTNIHGSSMIHTTATHGVIDNSFATKKPIYGLVEKYKGKTIKYSDHFMERINNIGEQRNNHISGDVFKKVKDYVISHSNQKGNFPTSKSGFERRIFVNKRGYKFAVRIEHGGVIHFKTLLAPSMRIDNYTEPRIKLNEMVLIEEYEIVYFDIDI